MDGDGMKVSELKAALEGLDDDQELVIIQAPPAYIIKPIDEAGDLE